MKQKKDKIRKLTWNFFWKQKVKEIMLFFGVVSFVYFFGFLGRFLDLKASKIFPALYGNPPVFLLKSANGFFAHLIYGAAALIILGGVIYILYLIFGAFYILIESWIKSNWEKATKRALEEIK